MVQDPQRIARSQGAPQALFKYMRVVGDEGIGDAQDTPGGTIVLLQLDDYQAGEIPLQLSQVFRLCTAPGIDRLIIIADHGETS